MQAIERIIREYAPGESAYAIGRRIEWPNHQMTASSPAGLLAYRLTHDQLGHEIRHSEAATYVTRPEREAWRRMRRDGRLPQPQQPKQLQPVPVVARFDPEPEPTHTRRMTREEIEAGRAADRAAAERLRALQEQERQRQAEHMRRTRRAWSMPAPRPVDRDAEEATRRASLAALEQMMARGM